MPGSSYPSPITSGVPTTFPINLGSAQKILSAPITILANGRITIVIAIKVDSPNSSLQIVRGGTAYTLYPSTNVNGGTLNGGFEYDIQAHVQVNDSINFQMTNATSLALFLPMISQDT